MHHSPPADRRNHGDCRAAGHDVGLVCVSPFTAIASDGRISPSSGHISHSLFIASSTVAPAGKSSDTSREPTYQPREQRAILCICCPLCSDNINATARAGTAAFHLSRSALVERASAQSRASAMYVTDRPNPPTSARSRCCCHFAESPAETRAASGWRPRALQS